ncbi:MAG: orotate phosphoribosyltransferase [Aquificae bacterium]|nr:orotate phosphoribosyltransferase [Aquificota bacterium]
MLEREKLKALIRERSLKVASEPIFKLSSGKLSRYYVDLKRITFDPEGAYLTGRVLYELLRKFSPSACGGLTLGADPLAYAVSFVSYTEGSPVKPFVVRKEKKEHGMGRRIEGNLQKGERVVVLDDVVTTGSSALKALRACREEGLEVVGVVAVVDREEGGKENIEREGVPFYSVFKLSELLG